MLSHDHPRKMMTNGAAHETEEEAEDAMGSTSQPRLNAEGGSYRLFLNANVDAYSSRNDLIAQEMAQNVEENAELETMDAWDLSEIKWNPTRKVTLFIMLLLLILLGGGESVTYTVNGKLTMAPYRCFLNQLVVLVCVLFFFALEWAQRKQNSTPVQRQSSESEDYGYASMDDASLPWADDFDSVSIGQQSPVFPGRRHLQEHTWRSRWRQLLLWFFIMALCDTVSLYINLLASHNIGGSLRLILQQLSIPFSMLFSFGLLGRTFTMKHVIGALTVVLGVVMCMINVLKETPGQESSPRWALVYGLSCLPLALGGCLKEWVLLKEWCGANELNAYVSIFQLFLGFFLVPLGIMIQNKDMDHVHVDFDEILLNFWCGFKCGCLGIDSFDGSGEPMFGQDNCGESLVSTWLYVIAVCSFNLLMLWVIREGTAVLFFVANGVIIPLVGILSASPLYKALGLHAEKFTAWQFAGLCLTVGGCVYFGTAMIQRSERDKRDELIQSASSRISQRLRRGGSSEA